MSECIGCRIFYNVSLAMNSRNVVVYMGGEPMCLSCYQRTMISSDAYYDFKRRLKAHHSAFIDVWLVNDKGEEFLCP